MTSRDRERERRRREGTRGGWATTSGQTFEEPTAEEYARLQREFAEELAHKQPEEPPARFVGWLNQRNRPWEEFSFGNTEIEAWREMSVYVPRDSRRPAWLTVTTAGCRPPEPDTNGHVPGLDWIHFRPPGEEDES